MESTMRLAPKRIHAFCFTAKRIGLPLRLGAGTRMRLGAGTL